MSYQRIFWLDDSPNFFDRIEADAQNAKILLDLSAVVRRTIFAFDLEMAVEIVAREAFDLYILDGDFPNRAPDERREALKVYMQKVRAGSIDHWEQYPHDGDHKGNVNNNAFFLYEQQRSNFAADAKVVVHSMSQAAVVLAYLFDLPIYAKGNDVDEVRRNITHNFERWQFDHVPGAWERFLEKNGCQGRPQDLPHRPQADITTYEYGGRKDFIERYLL